MTKEIDRQIKIVGHVIEAEREKYNVSIKEALNYLYYELKFMETESDESLLNLRSAIKILEDLIS